MVVGAFLPDVMRIDINAPSGYGTHVNSAGRPDRGRKLTDDVVDVTVVEGAIRRHDAVVTSNESHIRAIVGAARARLRIEAI